MRVVGMGMGMDVRLVEGADGLGCERGGDGVWENLVMYCLRMIH